MWFVRISAAANVVRANWKSADRSPLGAAVISNRLLVRKTLLRNEVRRGGMSMPLNLWEPLFAPPRCSIDSAAMIDLCRH